MDAVVTSESRDDWKLPGTSLWSNLGATAAVWAYSVG